LRKKLTPDFVASAEAEPGKERSFYWDESLPDFGLMVMNTGHKSFVVQYRADNKSQRMRIGDPGTLKLGEARKEARAILGKVAKGGNPLAERRRKKAAAEDTLRAVCENYFMRVGKNLRTVGERQNALTRLVYPVLGTKPINEIKRSDITKLLDRIEDNNGPVMADRTLAYLRSVFVWHATRDDNFRSPLVRGVARTKASERARKRTLDDNELRAIWKAAGEMRSVFGPLVKFILLAAVRRDEAAHLRRDELEGKLWTIPAARYKGKHDHVVPLSSSAQAVLDALPVINGSKLVFTHDGKRPVGGFSKFRARLEKASGTSGWTIHDLRRTARTLLSRAKIDANTAERCMGHVIGGVRGTYDRYEYLDEKAHAFDALAELVERIVNPQENVVSLRATQ
jgi:integrase